MSETKTRCVEKSDLKPIWCPGCGDYGLLTAMLKAMQTLELDPTETVVVSGIGCSSRLPGYLNCFGFNSIHGRALPIATGVKFANPELTVIAVGGDGDMAAIGLNHLAHSARKNLDLTCLVFDNRIYGLTKGQSSPTTPLETITVTHSFGCIDPPLDILSCALMFGATFVARGSAIDIDNTSRLIQQAIEHRGFSIIQLITPCVSFRSKLEVQFLKENCEWLPETSPPATQTEALKLIQQQAPHNLGLFYQVPGWDYENEFKNAMEIPNMLGRQSPEELLKSFVP